VIAGVLKVPVPLTTEPPGAPVTVIVPMLATDVRVRVTVPGCVQNEVVVRTTTEPAEVLVREMHSRLDPETPNPGERKTVMTTDVHEQARERIRTTYLRDAADRPASAARGLHHTALISSDVEQTVRFYQGLLELPLTEVVENRDYPGSTHFFFDIGNGNLLAFFDFPGLDVGPYAEVLGGLHHVAISVEPQRWGHLRTKLLDAGVELVEHSEVSLYLRDPDGARLELIADPLGEMYGTQVL
jgi:catechol 2,3-dioxygenase-like lactoylglutathione lyase family enzyme